jgi:hypothetical protein
MIPRDTYKSIPPRRASTLSVRSLAGTGADGRSSGRSAPPPDPGELRLYNVRARQPFTHAHRSVQPGIYAHTMSDDAKLA